jgi:amidophosphoribosyltransferase
MCGIVGIFGNNDVFQDIYDGLISLQHRGQDAAGITTYDLEHFYTSKGSGLVHEIFKPGNVGHLLGNMGIGHTRYPTAGSMTGAQKAQPFFVNAPYGIILAHNGNVYNCDELRELVYNEQLRYLNTDSDSELLLNVFANSLFREKSKQPTPAQIFKAIKFVMKKAQGSYSIIAMIANGGLLAFRDPRGIRPLVFGKRKDPHGLKDEYIFASEDVTLSILDFEKIRDIAPGEAIFIDMERNIHSKIIQTEKHAPCIFEYVYFARPDSTIDNISVYKARLRMGEKLFEKITKLNINDIEVVVPVPDSGRSSALTLSHLLGVKYREGLVKNRYIGRTFIMPGQKIRTKSIKHKLNPIPLELKDKNVLLVDDSIVRGNTMKKIISMVRDAGARKVYVAIAAPPLISPCLYGIDMPSKDEFIANHFTVEEMEQNYKADKIIYQDLEDLKEAVGEHTKQQTFCTACFDGNYPTPGVTDEIMAKIAGEREKDHDKVDTQLTLI